jgi:hypothetical protein
LVVGHSNTVLEMIEALGPKTNPSIKDQDYDYLFLLTISASGKQKSKSCITQPNSDKEGAQMMR